AVGAVAVLAHAVAAALRLEVLLVAIVDQRIEAVHRLDHDIAASAAIAATRATEFDELLAPERDAAVPARTGLDINLGLVEEFHVFAASVGAYIQFIAMNSQPARSAILAGIGLMLTGIFFFALNDALGKWLIATYSVGQLLLVRSIAGLVFLVPFIKREGWGAFKEAPRPLIQLARPFFATFEVACFYWALAYMPLADVMTFYLAGPIYVTAMSPFLLREKVGWRRMLAVAAGFGGVLIALSPSMTALTPPAFVAIAGSVSFSILMICTRLVRGTSDVVLITTQTVGALLFGAVAAPFTWVALGWRDTALLIVLGVTAMVAHMCINR